MSAEVRAVEVEIDRLDDPALEPLNLKAKFVDPSLLDKQVEVVAAASIPAALPLLRVEEDTPMALFTSQQIGDQDIAGRAEEALLIAMREDDEARRREREYDSKKHLEGIKAAKAEGNSIGWEGIALTTATVALSLLQVGASVSVMHSGFKSNIASNVRNNNYYMGHLSKVLGNAPAAGATQADLNKFGKSMSNIFQAGAKGAEGMQSGAKAYFESQVATNRSDKEDAQHSSRTAMGAADTEQKDEDRLAQLYDRMVENNQRSKDGMSARAGS